MTKRRVSRRELIGWVSVGAAGAVLAACAVPAPTPTPAPAPKAAPTSPPAAPKPTAAPATPATKPATTAPSKLEIWTFAVTHGRWYRKMGEEYAAQKPNISLEVTEPGPQHHDKLLVALQAGGVGAPDIADIHVNQHPRFWIGQVQLADLNDVFRHVNLKEKMFDSRLVIYRHKGKQYALPVALTPVVLYYRVDLFEKAGVQVPLKTWDDFIVAGKKITRDKQFMTFVQPESWTDLRVHIRQRGGGLHDENGNVIFDQPSGVEALEFLADLKHKHKIAVDAPAGPALWGAVKEGAVAALWGADWYATFLSDNAPELSGKWAAQYLPAVKAGDRKTSAAGGTGTALLKTSKQLDEAARFLEWTFLDPNRVVVRYQMIDLYPPLKEALKDPRMREPRPYYGGQRLGELFAELAPDVPTWYNHPAQGEGVPAVQRLAIRPVMEGKKSVKEAVAEAAAELRKLTEQYNK